MAVLSRGLFCFYFLVFTDATRIALSGALPPANSPPPYGVAQANPFKPSVGVLIGAFTTMFSITFLLLLYAKHCKRVNSDQYSNPLTGAAFSSAVRNSGIDRSVIESLPIFRFSSLIGQKEGLECAVCLSRFQPSEVLRLLPKCKHAFHVECVDTWLDAHSTCPLCRYRVDPEDILLVVDHAKMLQYLHSNQANPIAPAAAPEHRFKRVLGRHSSAGEKGSKNPAWFRRSVDSLGQKKRSEPVTVGGRKDGLLLSDERCRFEHRIVVSRRSSISTAREQEQRWSDVQPLDLLYLRSEMIMSPSASSEMKSIVINERSVSEITGMSRFEKSRERHAGVASRWLAWIASQSRPQESEDVRPAAAAPVAAPSVP